MYHVGVHKLQDRDYRIQMEVKMNYSTVCVGMDVHKDAFSLCYYTSEKEVTEYPQKVEVHYIGVHTYPGVRNLIY